MPIKELYLGSVGPLLYDDAVNYALETEGEIVTGTTEIGATLQQLAIDVEDLQNDVVSIIINLVQLFATICHNDEVICFHEEVVYGYEV